MKVALTCLAFWLCTAPANAQTITLTAPNGGGEVWLSGSTLTITWTSREIRLWTIAECSLATHR